jgi:hypothetical protein
MITPARLRAMRALRWPLVLLLFGSVGVAGARAGESWLALGKLRHVVVTGRAALHDPRIAATVHLERQFSVVQVAAAGAIGVTFLIWWALAYRNLESLGIRRRATPGWAVLSWFVPLVGFVAPKRVAEELWWGSDANTPIGWSYGPGSGSALVTGWWACWLASLVLPPMALVALAEASAAGTGVLSGVAEAAGAAFVASAVLSGVAGLCAAALVMGVTSGQEERAQALNKAGLLPPLPA